MSAKTSHVVLYSNLFKLRCSPPITENRISPLIGEPHLSWGQKLGREDDGGFCTGGEVAGETDHTNRISITPRTQWCMRSGH
jgi:hypothetical protein